jgi:hypothetical protein
VYVYNNEEQILAQQRGAGGDETFTFDLSGYEPGSYAVVTYHDGDYTAIQPVVVSGYDVTMDAPGSVASDEQFTITADVTPTAVNGAPDAVRITLVTGGNTITVQATKNGNGYTATVDASTLDETTYEVYALAQSDTEAFGRYEVLGFSDSRSLSVTAAETQSPSGGGGVGGGAGATAATTAPTNTATVPSVPTKTPPTRSAPTQALTDASRTATPEPTTDATVTLRAETPTPAPTTKSVITPAASPTTEPTAGSGPGFGVPGAVAALGLWLLGRRHGW